MDLLDFVGNLGVVVCVYIVIFTSKELTTDAPYGKHTMYILAFFVLHFIFLVKFILAEMIEDEPSWIKED